MRKILSAFLVFILVFALCGCAAKESSGETANSNGGTAGYAEKAYADSARTYVEGKGEDWTLNNTYNCLTEKKQLNVAYIGGSVTVGTGGDGKGSWRQLTTQWLSTNFPEAEVNETHAGIGGTASLWGLFRLDKDVLAYNPDLVFIEFGVNDSYCDFTEMQSAANMDAMIRKINEHNPNTDIILVFTTDNGKMGKDYDNIRGHRTVAEYYGVPYIDVGAALVAEMAATGNEWSYYVADSVHPNLKGYKVYADTVEKYIKQWLDEAKGSTAKEHKISDTPAVTNPYNQVKEISLKQFGDNENWRFNDNPKNAMGNKTTLSAKKQGAKITFEFEGSMLGLYYRATENCGIRITLDSESPKTVTNTISDDSYDDKIFLDNLAEGKHTVTIEYLGPGFFIIGGLFIG